MNFKIGDRIRAYTSGGVFVGKIERFTESGDIEAICKYQNDTGTVTLYFHPKQCRKLKPKKRQEWWINIKAFKNGNFEVVPGKKTFLKEWVEYPDGWFFRTTPPLNKEGWIKLREVKE